MDYDIDDAQAQAFQEALIQQGLSHARAKDPSTFLPWTGRCHNCAERITDSALRFCDAYCHEDWDKRERAKRMRRG